jgi:N-acetylneuraminic acid mutarotase
MKIKELFKEKELSVFDKHRKNIALKTLKMNDVGVSVMGGMNKEEAREFLKKIGYSDERIKKLEESLSEEKKELSVFDKHRKNIALKTLKMNDVGVMVMGGMNKAEARAFLKKIGYTDEKIKKIEDE